MNPLGCLGSSVVIARIGGNTNISMAKKKMLVHDCVVCDERALLIVSLRALEA